MNGKYFTPGGRSFIKQSYNGYSVNRINGVVECPKANNKKVLLSSNNESTGTTTLQRQFIKEKNLIFFI
jgi:hypothetical protein